MITNETTDSGSDVTSHLSGTFTCPTNVSQRKFQEADVYEHMDFHRKCLKAKEERNIDILVFGHAKAGKKSFAEQFISDGVSMAKHSRSQ